MRLIKFILALTVVLLSGYSLITGEYGSLPYTQMLLGLMLLVMGMSEMQENRKVIAILLYLAGSFSLFVSVYILFI
ncbi:Protein of unknown function [Lentibacillus persicus]|uniref:DUF3953 domain-containing protein n=1 Tax=Lentibacillus persicus TaxID=640948 RepID=A0A1I1S1Y1_9BACI|nr:DUF3953 domain-containing protein [Lentibacillus persicus]SFD40545.1 Protein of unknown function [Lentibacillus persicus]